MMWIINALVKSAFGLVSVRCQKNVRMQWLYLNISGFCTKLCLSSTVHCFHQPEKSFSWHSNMSGPSAATRGTVKHTWLATRVTCTHPGPAPGRPDRTPGPPRWAPPPAGAPSRRTSVSADTRGIQSTQYNHYNWTHLGWGPVAEPGEDTAHLGLAPPEHFSAVMGPTF